MLIKRTAVRLLVAATLALLGSAGLAQVPAHSNLNYDTPSPSWENGGAKHNNAVPGPEHDFFPAHPMNIEPTFDWFAPAETSGYGRGIRPKIGWFGSMERLYWSMSKPSASQIGSPSATGSGFSFPDGYNPVTGLPIGLQGIPTIFTNTADTNFLQANGAWGNRFEFGYVDTNDYGWFVSILDHVSQSQFHEVDQVIMQFDDPSNFLTAGNGTAVATPSGQIFAITFGKIPIRFDRMYFQNITRLNGVELTRMYRAPRLHDGGFLEVLYGVRWLQMMDTFNVYGANSFNSNITNPITPSGDSAMVGYFNPLSDSWWSTRAFNNMVGPQIGLRWFKQRGRWTTSVETRFMAAANFQAVHQITNLGTNLLPNYFDNPPSSNPTQYDPFIFFQGLGSHSSQFTTTFSPVGELRVNTAFQITRAVALKVGYTGLVAANVTRASNRVDYSDPNLIGIKDNGAHQTFFVNGVNFGIELNR